MGDKLEEEIRKVQKEAADLKRRAEAKELELKALQRAAELRPPAQPTPEPYPVDVNDLDDADDATIQNLQPISERRGGRQPGAISRKWRGILNAIYNNEPVTIEQVVLLASAHKLDLQAGSAQSRMNRYIELGYIEALEDGQFRVTPAAVNRFDLKIERVKLNR